MDGEFLAPTTEVDYPSTLDKYNTKSKSEIDICLKLYNPKNDIVEGQEFTPVHFTLYNRAMPGTANPYSQDQRKNLFYVFKLPHRLCHLG